MSKKDESGELSSLDTKIKKSPVIEGIEFATADDLPVDVATRKIIDKQPLVSVRFPVRGKKISKEELAAMKIRRINPEAQYVTICVNGVIGRFERGVDLKIPKSFYEVWNNSDQQ